MEYVSLRTQAYFISFSWICIYAAKIKKMPHSFLNDIAGVCSSVKQGLNCISSCNIYIYIYMYRCKKEERKADWSDKCDRDLLFK